MTTIIREKCTVLRYTTAVCLSFSQIVPEDVHVVYDDGGISRLYCRDCCVVCHPKENEFVSKSNAKREE